MGYVGCCASGWSRANHDHLVAAAVLLGEVLLAREALRVGSGGVAPAVVVWAVELGLGAAVLLEQVILDMREDFVESVELDVVGLKAARVVRSDGGGDLGGFGEGFGAGQALDQGSGSSVK